MKRIIVALALVFTISSAFAKEVTVTKQVLKTKGTIKFGVDDIFNTRQFTGIVKYSDVNVNVANRRVSRQYNINFSYRFGKKDIPAARRKNGGAGDEQNRVGGGGGN